MRGMAGANLFDVWWVTSSGMPMGPNVTVQDAIDELDTAQAAGIPFFRFFAGLWGSYAYTC